MSEVVESKWLRPKVLKPPDPENDSVVFQQMDIDHYEHLHKEGFMGPESSIVPVTRMFGVTRDGHSILCHVHGFHPYFYIYTAKKPDPEKLELFRDHLDSVCKNNGNCRVAPLPNQILRVEHVVSRSVYGYSGKQEQNFLKIFCTIPQVMRAATNAFQKGDVQSMGVYFPGQPDDRGHRLFETNIEYEIRFMADNEVYGCSWVELPAKKYKLREQKDHQSLCQIECDINYVDFIAHPPEGDWAGVAPLRTLSFDIECANRKGVFPEPEHDAVIQIANMVVKQGVKEPFIRCIFTLRSCAPIAGATIRSFETEEEMLLAWKKFIVEVDPDLITGYNIQNFDFGYLLNRAKTLNLDKFPYLGRVPSIQTKARSVVLQSQQLGKRENLDINIEGRVQFDLILVLRRDFKLRSYKLNAVSYHFLQEQKEDVHYSIITDLFNGNEQTRRRLAVYCLKDALLPLKLLDKLMCVINYMEMARVTGVPLGYLLTRGQQIKVISQILREAKKHNYILPTIPVTTGEEFEGATVLDPMTGYYNTPIATLDFASLYPSIIIAHNLCYTTLLNQSTIEKHELKPEEYIRTPSGFYFKKPDQDHQTIVPQILKNLLSARKRAKDDLKRETDPFKKIILDGRQLALKVSANSVYGFTGAQVGKLPCLEISQSVTGFGREMIETTRKAVAEHFTIANGYKHDAIVIYGDTDSVMVKFGVPTVAEAMELGREAAAFVSQQFVSPIKLEFEKVYFPYLLINKKRYAGLYWTKPDKHDKMDCKGIETVRRDNCTLVANLIDMCLQKILMDRDPDGAVKHAQRVISDLLCNRVDISHLVITKELSKTEGDYKAKQAHVELADRMKKRDPAGAPKLGDRVPYVIINAPKGTPAYMKSEEPLYVLENNIPIDTDYYLTNQLSKPLLRIFEPILGEKAESQLLRGDHTRVKKQVVSKVGALSMFTKKRNQCLGCKTPLTDDTMAVCSSCQEKESELYLDNVDKLNEYEVKFSRLWTQCQRCQGNLHEEVICTSSDCPIFYMRKKVQKDLADQHKVMQRFGVPAWDDTCPEAANKLQTDTSQVVVS